MPLGPAGAGRPVPGSLASAVCVEMLFSSEKTQ